MFGALAFGVAIVACGSGDGGVESTTSPTAASAAAADIGSRADAPDIGEQAQSVMQLDAECQNSGSIEAFDVQWFLVGSAPADWEGQRSVEGVLEFESWDLSTFNADDGRSVGVTFSRSSIDECLEWG